MRTHFALSIFALVLLSVLLPSISYSQAANNTCANAATLTPASTCTAGSSATGNLQKATSAQTDGSLSGSCGGVTAASTYDVWYKFQASSAYPTITISNINSLSSGTTYVEILSGTNCGSFSSLGCHDVATSLMPSSALTIGTLYYVRVYTTTQMTGNPKSQWDFDICIQDPPTNDDCNGAIPLTSNVSCNTTSTAMNLATSSSGLPVGCESAGVHYDVWYSFVAVSTKETVTISSFVNISSPEIQLYSGSCGSLTSLQCGTTSLTATGLTIGTTYFVRVSNVGSKPNNTSFTICVTNPPANDECANAISLYSNTSCSNVTASVASATPSSGIPLGCAAAGTYYDVWFSFAAAGSTETVSLSGMTGSGITTSAVQLYSGTCGALTSVACGTTNLTATGLSIGTTYYVRVSSVGAGPTATGNFNICVTHPAPSIPSIDYSKSYINVTKGSTGGTVNPGDTLEMRATLAIRSGTVDSLSFTDTLFNTKGLRLVPGSIALRTNEGKIYGNGAAPFTDALDTDAGWHYQNGLDTIIKINFGTGATNAKRGSLSNTSRPSVFGGTCIIMATYRVVVYAGYNSKINFKTGALTFRNQSTSVMNNVTFAPNNLIVYQSPGLCPNAVSATNAVGAEFNGTFGTALAQNRSASPYTTYVYSMFSNAGGPQDYYYGIANNTSSKYTAITTWPKPDNGGYRVFSQWDISGDHTNASNPLQGNPPCDNTKPISPSNPCGYMLVVNSAYKADTAFTYNITNLCPNTYYELSAWFKNICYKCGCDSTGAGSGNAGYIPTAPGDSSGVRPNIAFDVNGTDYYTTGDVRYIGTTPTGSDASNQWVKRGFVYLTGPSETSFLLTLRNNAPGGGGNDWALDDISVATCLPNMQYSPSLNPTVCEANTITINDTIRSYFNTYQNFKWQRSTDNGTSWSDISGATGAAAPGWNGTEWEYITSYTIPPTATNRPDSGNRYRVVVSTTSGNLANSSCQVTDGVSIISLNVLDCGVPLSTDLLSFNGKLSGNHSNLSWSTSRESEPLVFHLERSIDGINFTRIGKLGSHRNLSAQNNYYSFIDSSAITGNVYYRLAMTNEKGKIKYSRTIQLGGSVEEFNIRVATNPFDKNLIFNVAVDKDSKIEVLLLNAAGKPLKQKASTAYAGINNFSIENTGSLPSGIYILQVQYKEKTLSRKLIKK